MTFTIHRCEQRTPEWDALRLGRVCASRAGDMLATIKTGEAAGRRNLRIQLVLERITGRCQERRFVNQAMQDGIEREAEALAIYQAITGTLIDQVGFISHGELSAGCSPDGIINDLEGGVEAKCPLPATHLEYLRSNTLPREYFAQIVHTLWITGAQWWDWLSYQPEFPEALQVKLTRVHRKEVNLAQHEDAVRAFLDEVEQETQTLRTMADLNGTLKAAVA